MIELQLSDPNGIITGSLSVTVFIFIIPKKNEKKITSSVGHFRTVCLTIYSKLTIVYAA